MMSTRFAALRSPLVAAMTAGAAAIGLGTLHPQVASADSVDSYLGWREPYREYGPCIEGRWYRMGTIGVNPDHHHGAFRFKSERWTGTYYKTRRHNMDGVKQAVKYKICKGGAFTQLAYSPTVYVHRYRDDRFNCHSGSCWFMFSQTTGWLAGRG